MNANQRQQGDVKLIQHISLPKGAEEIKVGERGLVVAEGEHTGHYHAVRKHKNVKFYKLGDVLFVDNGNKKPILLEHLKEGSWTKDHQPIHIQPGITEFGPIHEMDHLAQMERKVVD